MVARRLAGLVSVALAFAPSLGCLRIAPPLKVAGEVVWSEASTTNGPEQDELLKVTAGDIVRFDTRVPVRVAEVIEAEEGDVTAWRTLVPEDGSAMLRAGLFTTEVRASRDVFRGAHTGAARKPEFAWFELEENAVAWAAGPLGTPFPRLSAARRFDATGFSELDEALSSTFADPGGDVATAVTRAVRTLVALRAVNALEGLRGFPYALNRDIDLPAKGTAHVIDARRYVLAEPASPIPVQVSGPVELFVWARILRTKFDEDVEVRITEAGHLRGSTRGLVRHELDRAGPEWNELSQLRHILVHVPPGDHSYTIEPVGTAAYVSAELSHPAARLEHVFSSTWREAPLLEAARRACEPASFGPACALVLALAGEESRPEYARSLAVATDVQKRIAAQLAQGGPADFAATLETRAMSGDTQAASLLAEQAEDTVDQSMHDAWKRATLRTTAWEPAPDTATLPKWLTFTPNKTRSTACVDEGGLGSRREVTGTTSSFHTSPWRRAHVLDLVAVGPCTGEPIQLEVDGQTLAAQPSAPRALWHVVVAAETAEVRRLDHGPSHVYSMGDDECSTNIESAAAPKRLDATRTVTFPDGAAAAGLEIWAIAGQGSESVTVHSKDGRETWVIEVRPRTGLRGLDDQGNTWVRGGRVPLPDWAKAGITVEGHATAAVRGLVRAGRRTTAPAPQAADVVYATAPDEKRLLDLGRRVAAATEPRVRASLLAERALLLAEYGAQVAATEDANAAAALGGTGASDPIAAVERTMRPVAAKPAPLLVPAFGLEPDFDAHAARCSTAPASPRAELAALELLLRTRPPDAPFDRDLAVRTFRAIAAATNDPRASSLEHLALRGSSWRLAREVTGGSGRVARPMISTRDRIFDPEGRLRPDIATGRPLGDNYVTVTADTPARAVLGGAKVRLDVVCAAPGPTTEGTCPFTYAFGDVPPHTLALRPGQVAPVTLPATPAKGRPILTLSVTRSDVDYAAMVRVVFDRDVEGTEKVADGWVLKTPHTQHRTLLTAGHPVRLTVKQEDIVRIDARADPGTSADVFARVDGHEVRVPTDGEPVVVAVPAGGTVEVAARSGEATVAIAERIAKDVHAGRKPESPGPPAFKAFAPGAIALDLSGGRWEALARNSPRPLSWFGDRLGTFEADTGVTAASLHEGSTTATGVDAYFFEDLSYQRRIEAPNLYTVVGASLRLRNGPPTYAGEAGFYEDLDRYRLRITGTATGFTQDVDKTHVKTLQANGFLEYSGRIRPDFFILPRLGYDGFYTNLGKAPSSTVDIDDDVYDPFRYVRSTLVFLQALIWYCPHFNDIYYIRLRADYDVTNGQFSHASVLLPGILLIFHQAELSFFADAEYFAATPPAAGTTMPVRPHAGVDGNGGAELIWHTVLLPGSFELRPNISTQMRVNDQSWSISAGINILASDRRGQRDYSSLELSFPEETSGGIPWRDESRVGP